MKIETKIQSQHKLRNRIKEQIRNRINERMEKQIQNFQNKNKTKTNMSHTTAQEDFNKFEDHISSNTTKFKSNPNLFIYNDNSKELEEFRNSSDYEQMWEIATTKRLTDSILEKFQLNNNRQKRQTKEDYVELTGQNINGSAIGPQDIFIEHYDCDAEEITNVKYYELNKISTCKFKPLDLDMTKTEVQLLSKAQAVEIKAYAVAGTIKERVEW